MVVAAHWHAVLVWASAAEAAGPLLFRLAPELRASVLLAMLGLVLVGVALVGLAIWGGRVVLREARKSHGPTSLWADAWFRKRLVPRDAVSDAHDSE